MSRRLAPLALFLIAACSAESAVAKDEPNAVEASTQAKKEYVVPEIVEDPLANLLPEDKNEVFKLEWADLLPPGEDEIIAKQYAQLFAGGIAEGSADDLATQIGTFNTVDILDGHKIKIGGFTVPFEYGRHAKVTEFLLVPYYGACLHQPPPPPNQTIHVKTDKPMKLRDLAQAVWVEGYVSTSSSYTDLANTAYTLTLTHMEVYDY